MTTPKKSTNVRIQAPTAASVAAMRVGLRAVSIGAPDLAATIAARVFTTARRHRRPAWERDVLAGGSPFLVPLGEGLLPAWSFGDERAPVVLLVHGWEGRGSQLGAFVAPLLERGLRVVTFDAPGHGRSTLPRGSLVDHARGIQAVSRIVGPLHGIVAHSMGGPAALLATRFGVTAERIALVAPPSTPRGYVEGFRKVVGLTPDVEERMVKKLEADLDISFATLDATLDVPALADRLLVVHDEDDREVPVAEGRRLVAAAPGASFVATRGLGHRRILRDAAVTAEVARFVATDARTHAADSMVRLTPARTFAATLEGELYFRDARWR